MPKQITIEPVTRVEGHGKVTIQMDDNNQVTRSRLHIVEFRGFERFVQGRPYWEAPVLVQRLCGICPVSHHLAAAKAMDQVVGAGTGDGLTPTAEKLRRLMHYAQIFQSHALHFFHLASPDLLFGINADPKIRNVMGVALEHRDLALQGIKMRQYGQEVIEAVAGKKIHGTGAIPGGVNKVLDQATIDRFTKRSNPMNIDYMIQWAEGAIDFFLDYHAKHTDLIDQTAAFPASSLSIVREDGAMDLYHGRLRAVDADGNKILDDVDYHDYLEYITEGVKSWTYMKFPYLLHLGPEKGWYRVGPLARMHTADFIPTPLAQKAFEVFKAYNKDKPSPSSMHMHWARLIEILHAAEVMRDLLADPDLLKDDRMVKGDRQPEGVGVIEAPRGTLIHHYRVGSNDLIEMANLIVSTTHNNEAMNKAVELVAKDQLGGHAVISEAMTNAVEVAIRAYDPCLSCATHALGQMPLVITLIDQEGAILDQKVKDA